MMIKTSLDIFHELDTCKKCEISKKWIDRDELVETINMFKLMIMDVDNHNKDFAKGHLEGLNNVLKELGVDE